MSSQTCPLPQPPITGSRLSSFLLTNQLQVGVPSSPLLGLITLLEWLTELSKTHSYAHWFTLKGVLKDTDEQLDEEIHGGRGKSERRPEGRGRGLCKKNLPGAIVIREAHVWRLFKGCRSFLLTKSPHIERSQALASYKNLEALLSSKGPHRTHQSDGPALS